MKTHWVYERIFVERGLMPWAENTGMACATAILTGCGWFNGLACASHRGPQRSRSSARLPLGWQGRWCAIAVVSVKIRQCWANRKLNAQTVMGSALWRHGTGADVRLPFRG